MSVHVKTAAKPSKPGGSRAALSRGTAIALAMGALTALPASAATITGWNTANVEVPAANPPDFETGNSVVYDRDVSGGTAGAVSNGSIAFTPPEALLPGIVAEQDAYTLGGPAPQQTAAGCIRASSATTCDGPFQSGKRFKEQITGFGPIDLVFDVDPLGVPVDDAGQPLGENVGYQVFHRLINQTGASIDGVTVKLGFGVGDDFVRSTGADGLGFSPDIRLGPNDANAFTQFPFGLFGDASTNPNFTLDGFFAAERSGLELTFGEDMLRTTTYYGPYTDLFDPWISQELVPFGGFWDFDDDATTDDLLMAWLNESGLWEARRGFDASGDKELANVISLAAPQEFATFAEVEAFLGVSLEGNGEIVGGEFIGIEDLANLNLNYAIALGDEVGFTEFTLRVAAVPAPPALPLLMLSLGLIALMRRARPVAVPVAAAARPSA